ncbi:MAG: zinc-binding dehydrogenase [Anaerolineae bacterium]|nr:zinc-binding dehydrogenase [Anaerolineae bacterium]
MKAAVFYEHGETTDVIQIADDLPIPEPKRGEVRLKMKAAALNRLDLFVRRGWKGLNLHFPHVIGSDGAGVVDALGEGVTTLAEGDAVAVDPSLFPDEPNLVGDYQNQVRTRIIGEHGSGFAAEYVVVPARNCVKVPDGFDLKEAAAAGLVYVTAWHSLIRRGNFQAGEDILIVGAGGGVNSASIQIARLAGAGKIYVVGSDAEKCQQAMEVGADVTINRQEEENWSKALYKLTNKRGVDVVVDNVGQATIPLSMRSLRLGGRILVVGGTTGYNASINIAQLFALHISIIGSTMGEHKDYVDVMNLIFEGKLKAVVGKVFPLSEAKQAQDALENFDVYGKVLIDLEA